MAAQDGEDEFFSDHDLDNLNPDILEGLEHEAIQFTQQQRQIQYESSDYGDDIDDDDLEEAVLVDEGAVGTQAWVGPTIANVSTIQQQTPRPVADNAVQPAQSQFARPTVTPATNIQPARPIPPPSTSTQREQFRQQRYGNNAATAFVDRSRSQSTQQPQMREDASEMPVSVEDLQRQLQEIMKERDSLKQDVSMKAGEIAIVRSKQEKAAKEYERELLAIKKLNADEQAKQKRAIEQAKDAERRAATELQFTRRDLAEEGERVKNLRKATNSKLNKIPTTPSKKAPHRDGFSDDEVQVISPSKFKARRSHPGTPTKARKRKAVGPESPIAELEIHVEESRVVEVKDQPHVIIDEALIERLGRQDDRLDFLQNMLNHRPNRGHLQTLEAFAQHSFPSSPNESFSSIILGKLPVLSSKKSSDEFPIDFCEVIISLWARCLREKYIKPIYLLIDLITHALNLKTLSIAPHILDSLLPIIQSTGDLIAIPRFKRENIPPTLSEHISSTTCLSLLYLLSLGCVSDPAHLTRFWRLIRLDFILMMLSIDQLAPDFALTLQLLRQSILPCNPSIGPISHDPTTQDRDTGYVIERATILLSDPPLTSPKKEMKLEKKTCTILRLEILRTLDSFSKLPIGAKALAKHPNAIGRLVSIISTEIDSLYDFNMNKSMHTMSAEMVTLATKLLHGLVTGYESEVGRLQEKVKGGMHRLLVSLARLALRDEEGERVLEEWGNGIGEWARELLEMSCTMEEADAIHEALVGVE